MGVRHGEGVFCAVLQTNLAARVSSFVLKLEMFQVRFHHRELRFEWAFVLISHIAVLVFELSSRRPEGV